MSMHGENQVRNFFVVNTSSATTMSAIRAAANLNGAVIQSDGTAAADNEEFALAVKNNRGEISLSDVINPERVSYAKSVAYSAMVPKVVTVSGITATANNLYQIAVLIKGFGSLSVEDEYIKKGFYKAKSGDNAENIVDGLVKNLAKNFSREQPASQQSFTYTNADATTVTLPDNLLFTFEKGFTTQTLTVSTAPDTNGNATVTLDGTDVTVALLAADDDAAAATKIAAAIDGVSGYSASSASEVVTITTTLPSTVSFDGATTNAVADNDGTASTAGLIIKEKSDWLAKYYVTGKKTRLYIDYDIDTFTGTDDFTVSVKTQGNSGAGTGYHVRNLEEYFLGNRGDTFRGAGYPHNFEQEYDSVLSGTYSLIEIGYWDESRDEPMKSKKQLTIAAPSTAVANTLIGQINTALTTKGITVATL